MKTSKLSIPISEDVYSTLKIEGYTKAKLEKNAKQNLAISLFSEGVLSFGKAAELAGMNKWKFMDLLREKKIPFYEPTDEEVSDEYKAIYRIAEEIKSEDRK
ncbi:MAG: hypothetical protein COW04_02425 [Deltaproteobacteria bacterium CG12_big_fil_rev_8_21_14_0_65_43_10]|nr:MAG: hypothetical protein COW04_02425 [Deltaproteobacteria bacterium CG12_big_fil_rev_8_21_14_0_65_43_10]PIU85212.1 MAG: hypothetical protein COS67_09075 [Deltaproteobacteria bacterium CG06_land_8_20_14_3_00_44_19]PIX24434.1 MAG: hypothetical protein COZ68_06480 [Deltaproteobacteria bacterium CG_4_8_14_3_um_filter_43_13]